MSFDLDINSAKSADNISSGIREAGKYIGKFTRAEKLLSSNGAQGVGLSFKSNDGQTADYLDLYTQNADGKDLPSLKIVHAIMACLQLRKAETALIKFEKWDKASSQRIQVEVEGYPDFMNKDIGILLQKELYTGNDGAERERVIITGVFQAKSELTASEVLNRETTPKKLEAMVQALMARPVRDSRKKVAASSQPRQSVSSGGPDIDDDIPWAPIPRRALTSM